MAPEVAAVERKGGYNHLCDIWAVGITAIGTLLLSFHKYAYTLTFVCECSYPKVPETSSM